PNMADHLWLGDERVETYSLWKDVAGRWLPCTAIADVLQLASDTGSRSLVIFAPAQLIDDQLLRAIAAIHDRYVGGVGIIPIFQEHASAKLAQPHVGSTAQETSWAV